MQLTYIASCILVDKVYCMCRCAVVNIITVFPRSVPTGTINFTPRKFAGSYYIRGQGLLFSACQFSCLFVNCSARISRLQRNLDSIITFTHFFFCHFYPFTHYNDLLLILSMYTFTRKYAICDAGTIRGRVLFKPT